MDKVTLSSKNITPFGGLNLIYNAISKAGIPDFLDNQIGFRNIRAEYSYSDIVLSLFGNSLCQGSYVSDLKHLKEKFKEQFFTAIPSHDTVEYACQELKLPNAIEISDSGVEHQINFNDKLNKTLVALCVKTNQLSKTDDNLIFDFDNVVIQNDKQDSKKSYKKNKAYHPSFSFIGRLLVHIENHNGNTPAKYRQNQTIESCFDNLDKHQIKIKHFRADSASYQQNVLELVAQRASYFYIRNMNCASFTTHCGSIENWETVEINYEKKEVATTIYKPFDGKKEYRIVVTRTLRKDGQTDVFSKQAYNYYGIITNNDAFTSKEVIEFYNDRGDAENSNRYFLNDFNAHHLPFSDMDMNTVYLYLMAMSSILFEWIKLILVENKTQGIKLNMRVKAICFKYIAIASRFIFHSRQKILQVYSCSNYKILQI
jgi:Transposase DDE domain group 1